MAILRFEPNLPVEIALKFDGGKQVQSRIPEAPDQMMYTVCGDDTIYVPLAVAGQISQLGIKKAELFSICKRQQSGVTRWEVKRLSEATEPATAKGFDALPTEIDATPMARQLTTSINQVNQRKAERALETPTRPQSTQTAAQVAPNTPNSSAPIAHTVVSKLMASSLIAAFDATQEAERYAHAKGVELEFGSEDIRAVANTIYIQLAKEAGYAAQRDGAAAGGASWRQ